MRYSHPAALVMAALSVAVPHVAAQEPLSEEGFGFFYDSLVPHGDWVQVADYGPCWRPAVDDDWAPYTDGYWAYTDVGWTWVSHEPFGSIVYHYGRWLLSDRGWCWVPGADWSPAWVSWRTGPDYIGWAPLPPEVPWHPQRGISTWVDVHTEIGPAYYRFCSVRDFSAPVLSGVLFRPSRNAFIMVRTENVTQIVVRNSNVYCGGPGYDWVSGRVSGRVPLLRVAREENVSHFRSLQASGGGVQNIVYNNILVLPAPKRVDVGNGLRNVPAPSANLSFSKGWYSNAAENEKLRSHLNREWEQRRATPPPSTVVKDPNGGTVRLTAPSTEEKRAVLNEMAVNPSITPIRREKDPRGGKGLVDGVERTTDAPKAVPIQSPTPPVLQQPGGSTGGSVPAKGSASEGGLSLQSPQKPFQTGTSKPEESALANSGTSRATSSATAAKPFPRAVSTESARRNPFGSGEAVQTLPEGRPPSPLQFQKPGGAPAGSSAATGNFSEGGVNRQTTKQPQQGSIPRPEEPPVGDLGTSRTVPSSAGVRTFPRAGSAESPQRSPFGPGEAVQATSGAQPRGLSNQSEFDPASRAPSKPTTMREPNAVGGSFGGAAPGRSASESGQGLNQAPPIRSGAGFSQQPQSSTGGGVFSRGTVPQAVSSGSGVRGAGVTPPVQSQPTSRSGQPASVPDQAGRPRIGFSGQSSQAAPSTSTPAGIPGAGGGAGTGRPQSASSGPSVAPVNPPASSSPAAAGQKKKPGDPGYVPGTP